MSVIYIHNASWIAMLSSFRLILIILLINFILRFKKYCNYCKYNLINKLVKKDLHKSNLDVLYSIRYYRCIALMRIRELCLTVMAITSECQ